MPTDMFVRTFASDIRDVTDPWALRWTVGCLQSGQIGPLPWWLSEHRVASDSTGYVLATTCPQHVMFRSDYDYGR